MPWRPISTRVWRDEWFRGLSQDAKMLWLFLLTNPWTTPIPGLFCAGEAMLAEGLGWDVARFREAFREAFTEAATAAYARPPTEGASEGLFEAREDHHVEVDFRAMVVWVKNAAAYDLPVSPNVVRGWAKVARELPECRLITHALRGIRQRVLAAVKNRPAYERAFEDAFPALFGSAASAPEASPEALPKGMGSTRPRPRPRPRSTSARSSEKPDQPTSAPSAADVEVALKATFHDVRQVAYPPSAGDSTALVKLREMAQVHGLEALKRAFASGLVAAREQFAPKSRRVDTLKDLAGNLAALLEPPPQEVNPAGPAWLTSDAGRVWQRGAEAAGGGYFVRQVEEKVAGVRLDGKVLVVLARDEFFPGWFEQNIPTDLSAAFPNGLRVEPPAG